MSRLAALLGLARKPDAYVPHGPITEAIAAELLARGVWTCRTPTKPADGRPAVWHWRTGMTAQCQCCQGIHPVQDGRIVEHQPDPPTEVYCPKCHNPYNEDFEPVYMGKLSAPTCEACAMGEPTGYDDDGNPVHAGPDVGSTQT